ncbi:MAG: hypothetical protein ACT443_04255, partial [Gemmatimonadota bacterium]
MAVLELDAEFLPGQYLADEAFELDRLLLGQIASLKKNRRSGGETFNITRFRHFPKGAAYFSLPYADSAVNVDGPPPLENMTLHEHFERSGAWLFRWRSYLPLLLFGVVLLGMRDFHYPAEAHHVIPKWGLTCLSIGLLGVL